MKAGFGLRADFFLAAFFAGLFAAFLAGFFAAFLAAFFFFVAMLFELDFNGCSKYIRNASRIP